HILVVLTASIGLPFVLLSATSPLVQAWRARDESGSEPYHLFALSNLASLLALLSFPFLVEPRLTSHQQGVLWSALFVVFAIFCWDAAWMARRKNVRADKRADPSALGYARLLRAGKSAAQGRNAQGQVDSAESIAAPTRGEKLIWLSLSACGSMLLL